MMKTLHTAKELQEALAELKIGVSIGFVPTMGALHRGHLALVEQSIRENDITVCSIFVNPIQFNNPDDLKKYPRMPEADLKMLEAVHCDLVFLPDVGEMYPDPVQKSYDFGHLDTVMEGEHRPGHFNGVGVVVDRLFRIVKPDRAYFGLKDYQQLMVIREMVKQEGHNVEVIGCPIVREDDGLAMSSRNMRLSNHQRKVAPAIHKALSFAAENHTLFSVQELEKEVLLLLNQIPDANVEYATVSNANTLLPITDWPESDDAVLCVALSLGDIRLIDNMILKMTPR
jgi:pantoate--beta-alanine ligase